MTSVSASITARAAQVRAAQVRAGAGAGAVAANSDAQERARRHAEDVAIVDAVLGGDEEAFGRLVERYQRPLFWIAHDVLLDADEARDVVQEAFIRVHGALSRYDRRRDLGNWMYRIARNLAIDAWRRRRRRAVPVADPGRLPAAHEGGARAPADPSAAVDELAERVAAVLAELPVEYRLALTLRDMHGLAPREIARITDCSYPTARWRLHRARALFREAWEKRFEDPLAPGGRS